MSNKASLVEEYYESSKVLMVSSSTIMLMVYTCPDKSYVVYIVCRFMSNLRQSHWQDLKWTLHYLKGPLERVLVYSRVR